MPSDIAMGLLSDKEKLRATHAPEMPGTFSPPLRVRDPDMHHGTYVTHVPWCITDEYLATDSGGCEKITSSFDFYMIHIGAQLRLLIFKRSRQLSKI